MKRRKSLVLLYIVLLLTDAVLLFLFRPQKRTLSPVGSASLKAPITLTPTPTPYIFPSYIAPSIEKKDVYKIAMVGDSMTAALGPHGGEMSEYMNKFYKREDGKQRIIIDNFAVSSNILAIDKQLNEKITVSEYTFEPLLSQDYDLLLIESFGYNPLSEFGLEEGIKKQNEVSNLMTKLTIEKPKMAIVFVTTIAPNKKLYAKKTQPNNSEFERGQQADERIAYLVNHNAYAHAHNIPLINIYEKSLTDLGDGNRKYINETDNIHPSFVGVEFIGHTIGDYIYDNQILPHD